MILFFRLGSSSRKPTTRILSAPVLCAIVELSGRINLWRTFPASGIHVSYLDILHSVWLGSFPTLLQSLSEYWHSISSKANFQPPDCISRAYAWTCTINRSYIRSLQTSGVIHRGWFSCLLFLSRSWPLVSEYPWNDVRSHSQGDSKALGKWCYWFPSADSTLRVFRKVQFVGRGTWLLDFRFLLL